MAASGDILTWWLRAPKLCPKERWRPISFMTSEVIQCHFQHICWSRPSQKLSQVQGEVTDSSPWWADILNHHTHFQVQIKTAPTHNSFQAFNYWVSWIFSMIQTCFWNCSCLANMHDLHRCLNGTLSSENGNKIEWDNNFFIAYF